MNPQEHAHGHGISNQNYQQQQNNNFGQLNSGSDWNNEGSTLNNNNSNNGHNNSSNSYYQNRFTAKLEENSISSPAPSLNQHQSQTSLQSSSQNETQNNGQNIQENYNPNNRSHSSQDQIQQHIMQNLNQNHYQKIYQQQQQQQFQQQQQQQFQNYVNDNFKDNDITFKNYQHPSMDNKIFNSTFSKQDEISHQNANSSRENTNVNGTNSITSKPHTNVNETVFSPQNQTQFQELQQFQQLHQLQQLQQLQQIQQLQQFPQFQSFSQLQNPLLYPNMLQMNSLLSMMQQNSIANQNSTGNSMSNNISQKSKPNDASSKQEKNENEDETGDQTNNETLGSNYNMNVTKDEKNQSQYDDSTQNTTSQLNQIQKLQQLQQLQQFQQFQQLQQLQKLQQLAPVLDPMLSVSIMDSFNKSMINQFQHQQATPVNYADDSLSDDQNIPSLESNQPPETFRQTQPFISSSIPLNDLQFHLENNNNNSHSNFSDSNLPIQPQLHPLQQNQSQSQLQSRSNSNTSFANLSQEMPNYSNSYFTALPTADYQTHGVLPQPFVMPNMYFPNMAAMAMHMGIGLNMGLNPNVNTGMNVKKKSKVKNNDIPIIKRQANTRHLIAKSKITSNDPNQPKKYKCAHCTWSFMRASDLRRHFKSHKNPQYHCPFWNVKYATCPHKKFGSFNRLDVLKRHLKLVHYRYEFPQKEKKKNVIKNKDGEEIKTEEVSKDLAENDTEEKDSGFCLSCETYFTKVKDFIKHVSGCAGNTPMEKWKYRKNGAILNVRKVDPAKGIDELELRRNVPVNSTIPFNEIQSMPSFNFRSEDDENYTEEDEEDEDSSNEKGLNTVTVSNGLKATTADENKSYVLINDVELKPEDMNEALTRKRGRPKKNKVPLLN